MCSAVLECTWSARTTPRCCLHSVAGRATPAERYSATSTLIKFDRCALRHQPDLDRSRVWFSTRTPSGRAVPTQPCGAHAPSVPWTALSRPDATQGPNPAGGEGIHDGSSCRGAPAIACSAAARRAPRGDLVHVPDVLGPGPASLAPSRLRGHRSRLRGGDDGRARDGRPPPVPGDGERLRPGTSLRDIACPRVKRVVSMAGGCARSSFHASARRPGADRGRLRCPCRWRPRLRSRGDRPARQRETIDAALPPGSLRPVGVGRLALVDVRVPAHRSPARGRRAGSCAHQEMP